MVAGGRRCSSGSGPDDPSASRVSDPSGVFVDDCACPPRPAFLEPFRLRAEALASLPDTRFEQILIAKYPQGAGIGWHRDAPMFGPTIATSIGSPTVLRFRRWLGNGFERYDALLSPRSGYVLAGDARLRWQHGIRAVPALRLASSPSRRRCVGHRAVLRAVPHYGLPAQRHRLPRGLSRRHRTLPGRLPYSIARAVNGAIPIRERSLV